MLEKREWQQEATEVPAEFHARFEETLNTLEKRKTVYKKKKMVRVLAIAAALCVAGMATVMAAELFHWDAWLKQKLSPTEKMEQKLADDGIVQGIGQSVTRDGVTVTLVQSVQDSHSLNIVLLVEAPEGTKLEENCDFVNPKLPMVTVDGEDVWDLPVKLQMSMSGGGYFVSRYEMEQEEPNKKYYEIHYNTGGEWDLSGKTIHVTLEKLLTGIDAVKENSGETLAEGSWEFEWQTEAVKQEEVRFDINKRFDFGGYEILVKYVELSPLHYSIHADLKEALKVEEDERNTFTYTGDDPGMDLYGRFAIRKVEYEDGTMVDILGGGGSDGADDAAGEYVMQMELGKAVDVEKVKSVYAMQGKLEIPLK